MRSALENDSGSIADTSPRVVARMLEATGSTDLDVLFAAKTEYGRTFRHQRLVGLVAIAVGLAACVNLVLAPVGIPIAVFGLWYWRKGLRNLGVVETAYEAYVAVATR